MVNLKLSTARQQCFLNINWTYAKLRLALTRSATRSIKNKILRVNFKVF